MIILILILSLVLRLISLNQSLWLDEATTALVAKMSLADIFTKFLPGDFHPPFYYLVMKFWTDVFGYSEVSLRIPSIILGLGIIYFSYLIGKKLFNKKTGLLASILMSTSGLAIYYSQEARMYMMAAFLVSLAVYLFLEKKWIIFSIILMLVGMTDYVSLFILPVFFVIDRKNWKKILLSLIPLITSFILWSPTFIKQLLGGMSVRGSNWWNILGTPTLQNLALIPIKFIFGRISFDNKILYSLIVVIVSLFFGYLLYKSRPLKERPYKVLWIWLILPIVIGFIVSFKIPTLIYFRYLFCLPPFYLLLASAIFYLKKFSNVVIILLIMFNLVTSGYYLFNPRFLREDWRGLTNFVENRKNPNSITVFPANSNTEAYIYYAPDAKIAGPAGVVAGYNQIWLMDYLSPVFDPEGLTKSKVEALGYRKDNVYTFRGVGKVYLYNK